MTSNECTFSTFGKRNHRGSVESIQSKKHQRRRASGWSRDRRSPRTCGTNAGGLGHLIFDFCIKNFGGSSGASRPAPVCRARGVLCVSAGTSSLLKSVGIFLFYNGLEEMESLGMLEDIEMQSLLKLSLAHWTVGGDAEPSQHVPRSHPATTCPQRAAGGRHENSA